MSPESLKNAEYSEKSDVWMMGCTYIELLTRAIPHADRDLMEVGMAIRDKGLTPQIPDDAPEYMSDLLKRCFSRAPEDRISFAEAVEFLEAHDPVHGHAAPKASKKKKHSPPEEANPAETTVKVGYSSL